jgi:hypothetical protein
MGIRVGRREFLSGLAATGAAALVPDMLKAQQAAQAFNSFTLAGFTKMILNPHILFGSDYLGTAGSAGNVVRGLESYDGFTPAQLRAVERENALELLPRLRA